MARWWPFALVAAGCGADRSSTARPTDTEICDARLAEAPPRQIRLLTRREYNATVADLLPFLAETGGGACSVDADCDVASESCIGGTCQADDCQVVTFLLPAAQAEFGSVHVAGSFNGWSADAWPLTWIPEHAAWVSKQVVPDGEHAYKFVLDGWSWIPDPTNPSTTGDGYGGVNSVLVQDCAGASPAGGGFDPAASFPVEGRPTHYPFDNAAETGIVTSVHAEQYARAAEQLATAAAPRFACADEACVAAFVEDFGSRAFRRPLTTAEVDRYAALGVEGALRAFLQSPYFLYRIEAGLPEPSGDWRLDPYETASALSYLIVGTMPDDALMAAAASGALATPQGREAEARRLLEDPRARQHLADFAEQWLGIEGVPGDVRSEAQYPDFDAALGRSMVAETREFFTWVMFDGPRRYQDLLLSDTTFVDARLADLYGVSGTGEITLPPERIGLLGHASVLTATAHSDQSSPILRGLMVRERILCQTFPTPPADVGPVPEIDPSATTRERFAQHTTDPFCASCHDYIDPLGFGLEHFDAIGAYRATENGLEVDASGVIVGLEDLASDTEAHPFVGLAELARVLADSESARRCFATQAWRFSTGRLEQDADTCAISAIDDWMAQADGDLQEALVALVSSPDFVTRSTP